jgi:predicted enzyme related to lactoylglutathione lyase
VKVKALTALVRVKSVRRSIEFYAKLGFEVSNSVTPEGETEPSWAWLRSAHAHLMVTTGEEPVIPSQQGVLFYVYCDDVPSARADVMAAGIVADEICYPPYALKGEFAIEDPDGYVVMVSHT